MMIFLVLRVTFNLILLNFFIKQNTNEQNGIKKYLYYLYLIVFVLILSLPSEGWYLDKFNRT